MDKLKQDLEQLAEVAQEMLDHITVSLASLEQMM